MSKQSKGIESTPWLLYVTAMFLSIIGLVSAAVIVAGFVSGWMWRYWNEIEQPHATIIASIFTVYAAALASTLAPLMFRGQVRNIRNVAAKAVEELKMQLEDAQNKQHESTNAILLLAEQSKRSLNVLQKYALHTMGFVDHIDDLDNSHHYLTGFQESAAILCEQALQQPGRWEQTRAQFNGMWPGRRPYILKLYENNFVSAQQRDWLLQLADSRRFTREQNPEQIDLATLNLLNRTMKNLQDSFSAPD